jgi:hypothetical protein
MVFLLRITHRTKTIGGNGEVSLIGSSNGGSSSIATESASPSAFSAVRSTVAALYLIVLVYK